MSPGMLLLDRGRAGDRERAGRGREIGRGQGTGRGVVAPPPAPPRGKNKTDKEKN